MTTVLPVSELFSTIQGEATYTGMPSVFVRLQGCDVGCGFCDTKYTWHKDPAQVVTLAQMLAKLDDDETYAEVGEDTLAATIGSFQARHVVITGGEPCMYDLTPLTSRLLNAGRSVQIETSGTEPIRCDDRTWVTVSPKIGMPGGKTVLPEALCRADEVKVPVGKLGDIAKFAALWNHARDGKARQVPIWLQPLSTSEKATALCIEVATANGWRLSLQTHKFIGVR